MFRPLLPFSLALALAACSGRSHKVDLESFTGELPAAFSSKRDAVAPSAEWWKSLGGSRLNALVNQALANNGDLKAAEARIRAAEAEARKAGAALVPDLEATASMESSSRQESGGRRESSSGGLGLASAYEVDLWGRVRAGRAAAVFDTEAARADLQAARFSMAASVASLWATGIEQTAQLALLEQQLASNETGLSILELRNRRGQASAIDVAQQKQLAESVRGDIIEAKARLAVTRHALQVLLGEFPSSGGSVFSGEIPTPGPLPGTGVPADWAAGRPDLVRGMLELSAAEERVAVAVAERFPTFRLGAALRGDAPSWSALADGWIASIAADAVAPLLDGGARKAEVDRARARAAELAAGFAQNLRVAFAEVEDALVEDTARRNLLASLESQAEHARLAVERARSGYLRGAETYLRVLDAVRSLQSLERRLLTARRDCFVQRVNLCRALARSPRS